MDVCGDIGSLKRELEAKLPDRIKEAVAGYVDFSSAPPPEDAKGFSAYHNGCKYAIQHIAALLKLLEWSAGKGGDADGGNADLVEAARRSLEGFGDEGEESYE